RRAAWRRRRETPMRTRRLCANCRPRLVFALVALLAGAWTLGVAAQDAKDIDFKKAKLLLERSRKGEKLTTEEQAYLERARKARQQGHPAPGGNETCGREG